jgi:hypothetical protein
MGNHKLLYGTAVLSCGLLAAPVFAQERSRTEPSQPENIAATIQQIEKLADAFEDKFEVALDKSSFNGTDFEERLEELADLIEDEVDNMSEDVKENDSRDMLDHFENAMIAATGLNRVMLDRNLASGAETDWQALREQLNTLAKSYHRPALPNLTITTLVPVTDEMLGKAEIKHVMDRMESATDRFKEKFDNAIQSSTANMTDRERMFLAWSRQLEDVTDEMVENFKEQDPKEFQERMQNTMVAADIVNRIMLRSELSKAAHLEWEQVRKDLNSIATVMGYPVLDDTSKSG